MQIIRISLYSLDLPFGHGRHHLSGGRLRHGLDSTLVRVETDDGLIGWGESCPWGPGAVASFAAGVRAGLAELAPGLLGLDPSRPAVVYAAMDAGLGGHPDAKHAIDLACWDILGKLCKQPLYGLFGGLLSEYPQVSGALPAEHGEALNQRLIRLRAEACREFSVDLAADVGAAIDYLGQLQGLLRPGETVKCDAHGGWRVDEALQVMRATPALAASFEQPCRSYEECRGLYRACPRPIVLDETASDPSALLRGWRDGVCSAVNLKIDRVGGLSKALVMRDLCDALGIPLYLSVSGGSQIAQAAIVQLAHATPPERLRAIQDCSELADRQVAANPVPRRRGRLHAHESPGLGVEPRADLLGEPIAEFA